MLLTISTSARPATDLGYLLHKNPAGVHTRELSFGKAHVFYPEASEARCTAALLLDIDPVGLVRGSGRGDSGAPAGQYVTDRPYVASSFLSVAIARLFGTALSGRSKERQELAGSAIPLGFQISSLPCRGGPELLNRLFEPLGYAVSAEGRRLDEKFPEWGESRYFRVTLRARHKLADALSHLYVLIPVLDDDKHYWVSQPEVEKLLAHGEGWLAGHPERDLITRRYLRHQRPLTREALSRLRADEEIEPVDAVARDREEEVLEKPLSLQEQRMGAVLGALKAAGAASVLDLGCGEGSLLRLLAKERAFTSIIGMDASVRALQKARDRLKLDRAPEAQKERIKLFHGALTYRDSRLSGFDAAALVEVIEHLDPPRITAFERVVFEFARPKAVIVTTPNVEYNVHFAGLPAGKLRHRDHRFEWTRAEFRTWVEGISSRFGYEARLVPIGEDDSQTGPPTQMTVFSKP